MSQFWQSLPLPVKRSLLVVCGVALVITGVWGDEIKGIITGSSSSGSEETTEQERIEVDFVIKDNDLNPVQGARISFQWQGAVEERATDSNGFVRINIPRRNDIEVTIRKQGFQTKWQIINLSADSQRTVTYFIEKAEAERKDKKVDALANSLNLLIDDGEQWKQKIDEGENPEPEIYPYYTRIPDLINLIDHKCRTNYTIDLFNIVNNTKEPDYSGINPDSKEHITLRYHSFLLSQKLELLKTAKSFIMVSCQ